VKLERDSMGLAGLILEMKCGNELGLCGLKIFFWYSFCNKLDEVCDTHNRVLTGKLSVDFVAMYLVDPDGASCCFVFKLSFLDNCSNKIFDVAIFGNKNLEHVLRMG
jgi:hypothetical protein